MFNMLYVQNEGVHTIIIVLYMDDLVLTCNIDIGQIKQSWVLSSR